MEGLAQPVSAMDNDSKDFANKMIKSSEDEQIAQMAKEAEKLEKELGYMPEKDVEKEQAAVKEQEAEAPKFYDYMNKAGEAIKSEMLATAEQTKKTTPGQAMTDVGRGMLGGAVDFAQDVGNTLIDGVNALEAWGKSNGVDLNAMPDDLKLDFAKDVLPPKNPQEAMIRKIGQYLVPFAGSAKFIKGGSALVKGAKMSVSGALISAATTDPEDKHLSDLIKDVPWVPDLAVSMTEYLQSKPGDTRAESRFKNFAESLVVDGAFAGAFYGITKGVKLSKDAYKAYKAGVKPVVEGAEAATATAVHTGDKVVKGVATKEAATEVITKAPPKPKLLDANGVEMPSPKKVIQDLIGEKPTDKVIAKMRDANTTEAMMEALRGNPSSDSVETLVQSAKRGVVSDKEALANAKKIVADRDKISALLNSDAGAVANVEEATAVRMMWEREFLGLQNVRVMDPKLATPEQTAIFMEQMNRFIGVGAKAKAYGSESARVLRSLQQAVEAAPDDVARMELVNKYLDLQGGADTAKDLMAITNSVFNLKGADLVEEGVKLQKRSLFMRVPDALAQQWMEGVFWSPLTQARNLVGNMFSTIDNVATTATARGISILGDKTGLWEEAVKKGEVAASLHGMWGGIIEGLSAAKSNFKGEAGDALSKFGKLTQNITPEVLGIPETSWLGKTVQNFGYASSLGLKASAATDTVFRMTNQRMRTRQLLMREAVQQGLEGKALQEYVKNNLGNVPEHILKSADKYAAASVFNKPLEDVVAGEQLIAMKKMAESIPMGRAIFPFMSFGGNLADYMMNRTLGANFITPEWKMAMRAGGARKQEAIAKLALGTSLIGLGSYMAATGTLTGSGPKDYATRKALNAGDKGWQPMTIRFDDGTSTPINGYAPHGLILGMGADIAEIIGALDDDNKDAQYDLIGAATGFIGTYFTPSIIDDFGDFFSSAHDALSGEELPVATGKTMGRFFTGMVPFSGLTKQFVRTGDKTKYDTTPGPIDPKSHMKSLRKAWDAILNEFLTNVPIPGYSPGLPPQLNIFGEVVHYPPGFGPDLISPIFVNAPEDNIARAEMERLGMSGPYASQQPNAGGEILKLNMPDRYLTKSTNKKSFQIKLSPEQYHRYVQICAGVNIGEGYPSLKEAIESEVKNNYPSLGDVIRDEKGQPKDAAKVVAIKTIVSNYGKIATGTDEQPGLMYQEFPELAEKFHEYEGQRAEALGLVEGGD